MAHGVLNLRAVSEGDPGALDAVLRDTAPNRASRLARLTNFFAALLNSSGSVYLRVDSSTPVFASAALSITQASFSPGIDTLTIRLPGRGFWTLAAVASGADPAAGEFVAETSDTVTAAAIALAINSVPGLKSLVVATANTGTLTITSRLPGARGNDIELADVVDAGDPFGSPPATLSGGADPIPTASVTATVTQASLSDGVDNLTIGNVVLTADTAPSGENQWDIGSTDNEAAANLAEAINGHSKLEGIVVATVAANVVTVSWLGAGREAALVGVSEAGNGIALVGSSFAPATTEAFEGPAEVL